MSSKSVRHDAAALRDSWQPTRTKDVWLLLYDGVVLDAGGLRILRNFVYGARLLGQWINLYVLLAPLSIPLAIVGESHIRSVPNAPRCRCW